MPFKNDEQRRAAYAKRGQPVAPGRRTSGLGTAKGHLKADFATSGSAHHVRLKAAEVADTIAGWKDAYAGKPGHEDILAEIDRIEADAERFLCQLTELAERVEDAAYANTNRTRPPVSRAVLRIEGGPDGTKYVSVKDFLQANPNLPPSEHKKILGLKAGDRAYRFAGGSHAALNIRRI